MKNIIKLIAITAIVAIIGFSFIACDDGSGGGGGGGKTLTSITAVYTPTTEIFPDTTIDTLKEGLTVTAHYSDNTTASVTTYTLSVADDALIVGENTVTVTYTEGGVTKTTTFKITVDELTHAHNWQLKEVINPATCTTAGMGKWECTNITPSHYEDLEIAALGHDWNDTYTTIANATETTDGVEAITCKRDSSHTKDSRFNGEYATGTAGLTYSFNLDSYHVNRGTATGAVFIPDYYRPDADSPYLPVKIINSFGGTSPNTTLTSVRIGANVTALSYTTFMNCTNLETVTFAPNSQLTSIQSTPISSSYYGAFMNCTSLTSITIPASVTYISGQGATSNPNRGAFEGCTNLASVTFEEGSQLTKIGTRTFYMCDKLTSITIPASVTAIGQEAFDCALLASVTFEDTIPSSGFFSGTGVSVFLGDLRAKFYATDPDNGTPGTYIVTSGTGYNKVWEKQ